jgi:cobalt-zinc-cadmium efflux system protein
MSADPLLEHSHLEHKHSGNERMKSVMLVSLVLTVLFVIIEAIAGFQAHSLALLSDAGHNFTDAFALLLAALGVYIQTRPGDHIKTYGYQRAGVLAAFVNALTLVLLAGLLLYEAVVRFIHPEPVGEITMLAVASVALVLNVGIVFALGGHGEHTHDLNVRAAWIHMIGDAASCLAIIIGAIVIRLTGWSVIDPILSVFIAIGIVWTAWDIIRDTLNILLEGLPKGLKLADVTESMKKLPGVIEVHDLHIWSLGSQSRAMSCHVLIEDMPPSASDSILQRINELCCTRFDIRHTTVQFEHVRCALAETHCTAAYIETEPQRR